MLFFLNHLATLADKDMPISLGFTGIWGWLFSLSLPGLLFVIYIFFNKPNEALRMWIERILYLVLIGLNGWILYHTATRGATIGLIVGLFVSTILIGIFEKERRTLKKWAVGIMFATVILVSGFLVVRDPPNFVSRNSTLSYLVLYTQNFVYKSPVLSRFASINAQETTTKSRFMIWNMAMQGLKERPIL